MFEGAIDRRAARTPTVFREVSLLAAAERLGWRRIDRSAARIALLGCAVAVTAETAAYLVGTPASFHLGEIAIPPSVVPLAIVAVAGGHRAIGRPHSPEAARVFWVLSVMTLAVGATTLSEHRSPTTVVALALNGFVEEFMYRGAIPALIAFALVRTGIGLTPAALTGLALGGASFLVLPGHQAQFSEVGILPFAAFAMLAALAVWRSGALLEMAMLHAVINTINIGRFDGASDAGGGVLLGALMVLLVFTYIPVGTSNDLIIDLTGDEPIVRREVRSRRRPTASLDLQLVPPAPERT